jgi:hypothetical protein
MEQGNNRDVELVPLVRSSADEGCNHVTRLWDEYRAGNNRFDQAGEPMFTHYMRMR